MTRLGQSRFGLWSVVACGGLAVLACWPTTGRSQDLPTRPSAWPPAELAGKLKQEPKTDIDRTIKQRIGEYEARLGRLNPADPLAAAYLPRLRDLVGLLYREYNLDKARYTDDCFSVEECLQTLSGEMACFLEDGIEKGKDPSVPPVPTWLARVTWVDGPNIIGQYHLSVPKEYDPRKSWPLAISYQNGPEKEQRRTFPYFFITSVQKAYPHGLTMVEGKTRAFLKDAAREFNIDPFRFYATGFSYGGHTDLTVGWRFPHWFAAITPLCSDLRGPEAAYVKYLKNVPCLLLHGEGDSFLGTGKVVYDYMRQAGCNVTFQTYPGGHDAAAVFRNDVKRLVDFWDKHVMNPYPTSVTHLVEHPRYSRAFWVDAKLTTLGEGSSRRGESGREAPGVGTFEVRVREGNRIEIEANDQVAELDLYLTDRLVDMSRSVTVVSGGKTVYQGQADKKVTVKLRPGQDYRRGAGDTLWQDILEIRKSAPRPRSGQTANP